MSGPRPSRFSLEGRAALVTGGSRGIGRAISLALAEAGAAVAVSSRRAEACESVAAEIAAAGGTAVAVPGHAGRQAEVEATVGTVMDRLGRLDILVNNAATSVQFGPLVDATEEAFSKTLSLNLLGPWRCTRACVAAWMGAHGGSVINMASIEGLHPEPFLGAYGASKAALVNMTRVLARELGPSGIRVNAIAPGLVRTDFARVLLENESILRRYTERTALGRVAEPEEIAGAAVWLASEAAGYVTGTVVLVDGGHSA